MYKGRKPYRHVGKEILKALATGLAIYIICSSPTGTRRLLKGLRKEWSRQSARVALKNMRGKGWIEYRETSKGKLVVALTRLGRKKVQEVELEDLKIEPPKHWDGYWHIIIFDIVEERKKARDTFRKLLQQLHCAKLQRSVFLHPYPCEEEIELIRDVFGIPEREVLYIRTKEVPFESRFRKIFRI